MAQQAPEKLEIPGGYDAVFDCCKRRFFIAPSFEIYNGIAGLYDYGPVMTSLKANFIDIWRRHFVINESMVEIETTAVTPECVFQTSGHVEKFADVMTKDPVSGECFRVDKLLEEYCEKKLNDPKAKLDDEQRARLNEVHIKADGSSPQELYEIMQELGVKSPKGNELSEPFPFNLMFATQIGPDGRSQGYLRPELAQGIFMNFKRILEFNNGKMPIAGACIGGAFRNEIAPRGGLARLREFALAEIEHFVDPEDKNHPKFVTVKDVELDLWPRERQESAEGTIAMKVGDAVEKGVIANETLGYFVARVGLFLRGVGARRLRFRQHRRTEMAHYACDCWDAELLTAGGWLECVGIADRSCFDLDRHSRKTKVDMNARVTLKQPIDREVLERRIKKAPFNKTFKGKAAAIQDFIENGMTDCDCEEMDGNLDKNGSQDITVGDEKFQITREMVEFKKVMKRIQERVYTPNVIEPSFGIGRILWSVLEQNFAVRGDGKIEKGKVERCYFTIPPSLAPFKAMICPLMAKDFMMIHVHEIAASLSAAGLTFKVDDATNAKIGKRYARTDELGIPFTVTVDHQTDEDQTVTIRERDSMKQIRVPKADLTSFLSQIVLGNSNWEDAAQKYPSASTTEE